MPAATATAHKIADLRMIDPPGDGFYDGTTSFTV
jgi:hypothetical protein